MASQTLLDGEMRLEVLDGFVKVWHARPAKDVEELDMILSTIDEMLRSTGSTRIMFDSRESEYRGGEVQARMWDWLSQHPSLRRVATLVTSDLLATSVNMTGVSRAVKIKAFALETAAARWLREG